MIHIFHHGVDGDGLCAGHIAYDYYIGCGIRSDYIKIHPSNYGMEFPYDDISRMDIVAILDFSFSPEVMEYLITKLCDIHFIDHHKTAIDGLKDYAYIPGIRIDGISGCELTWFYYNFIYGTVCKNNKDLIRNKIDTLAPKYIRYIGDYDTWTFKYGELSKYLNNSFNLMINDITINSNHWKDIFQNEREFQKAIRDGKAIESYKDSQRRRVLNNNSYIIENWEPAGEGTKGIVINAESDSALFDTIIEPTSGNKAYIEDFDYGVMYVYKGDKWVYSLRSRGDYDVSELAKRFSGGGHKQASGFSTEELVIPKGVSYKLWKEKMQ